MADGSLRLDADVREVDGVSARVAGIFANTFDVRTVRDLIEHYPHADRYRDIGAQIPLAEATLGEPVTVVGDIMRWTVIRPRSRRMTIAKANVMDDYGGRVEVPFFNQEWRAKQSPEGTRVAVSGTLERFRGTVQLKNAKLTVLAPGEIPEELDRVQATYPATESLPSWRIAKLVAAALDALPPLPEHLPETLAARHGLMGFDDAVRTIHRPPDLNAVRSARDRLVYDELLSLQVGLQQRRHRLESEAIGLVQEPVTGGLADHLLTVLPFTPTAAQDRAFVQIGEDLERPKPMHRLLQGDVGSGKTLVAAWTMLRALDAGRQAVLMAPTSVLAEQHFRTFMDLLSPLGVNVLDGPGWRW